MLGKIEIGNLTSSAYDPNTINILPSVSCRTPKTLGKGKKHIIIIDCGSKENIIRSLLKRNIKLTIIPWDFDLLNSKLEFDGVVISNGPGNPENAVKTIQTVEKLLKLGKPVFGICLGNQILALASGAKIYKLKYGHRGQNQPVMNLLSKRAIITSQNHGFAVKSDSLGSDWIEWFVNLNDGSNEGIRHKSKPFFSVQFHPEASPGPLDSDFLFDEFLSYV